MTKVNKRIRNCNKMCEITIRVKVNGLMNSDQNMLTVINENYCNKIIKYE